MRLIYPSFVIKTDFYAKELLSRLERIGRICYKSEDKATETSAENFIRGIIKRGHESVIEHESISILFIIDRGVSHELVRHRLCAFSQESTRYCNYKGGVTFIIPPWVSIKPGEYTSNKIEFLNYAEANWFMAMQFAENCYQNLLAENWSPQQARSVLPNSLKTEIVVTANLREWRHILRLRTSSAAHPQMREIMIKVLAQFRYILPCIFEDIDNNA